MQRLGVIPAAALCLLAAAACGGRATATITVDLTEWDVRPSSTVVAAGKTEIVAHNRSAGLVHELIILRADGDSRRKLTELEDIAPGASARARLTLTAGTYELICAIVPGEAGSTVDHYLAGMHTLLQVR